MGASAADLLIDLARLDIELVARGDRLRYRPRSAVTADLAERLKTHEAALLAILGAAVASDGAPTATVMGEKLAPSPQAASQPALLEEAIDPPPPCSNCGSRLFWWNLLGDQRCMSCDPPIKAIRLLERTEEIRRRCGKPSPAGAAEMLADLKRLTDT